MATISVLTALRGSTFIVLRQRKKLHPCGFDTFCHVHHQAGLQVRQGGRFTQLSGNVSKFTMATSSLPVSPLHLSQPRGADVLFFLTSILSSYTLDYAFSKKNFQTPLLRQ